MSMDLNVDGMSCGHCVSAITAAVEPLPGVAGVTVDLDNGTVTVSGAPDEEAVVAAIEDCGYDVRRAA
jgi:copper chaperone CopZ